MKPARKRTLLLAFLLLHVPLAQAADGAKDPRCRELKLVERKAGDDRVYRLNNEVSFRIGRDPALDTATDYGARLMLLKKSAAGYSRSYYSTGAKDSYGISPTFIANCGANELLILGEMGSEYSWGLAVFSYNDGKVEALGAMPIAVEGENDAESVVPFMRFSPRKRSAIVSFGKDLIHQPGSPGEKKIARSKLRYRIDHNKLTEMQP